MQITMTRPSLARLPTKSIGKIRKAEKKQSNHHGARMDKTDKTAIKAREMGKEKPKPILESHSEGERRELPECTWQNMDSNKTCTNHEPNLAQCCAS